MSGGLVALGVVWILVVIHSYLVLRPARLAVGAGRSARPRSR
ncbi:hypothetical protein [Actinomadura madurae]|nr:hypothetical protein [Actinomadura madurae]